MAEAEGVQSLAELQANLAEYRGQYEQVQQLVELEPENEEYGEMLAGLREVIDLTAELIRDQQAEEAAPSAAPPARRSRFGPAVADVAASVAAAASASAMPAPPPTAPAPAPLPAPAAVPISTVGLPAIVAEQIKAAQAKQARSALLGTAPPGWAVGHACRAKWSGDGEWYDAKVEAVTASGAFVVVFEEYGETEQVSFPNIEPPPEVEEVYKGVSAPKRRKVEEAAPVAEIPKNLMISETDDAKTVQRKKKVIKKLKSERRFAEMDNAQKARQQSWQSFQKGGKGGGKKKAGFFTGRKKESMFKSPDTLDGKVGVVGSGRKMTEFHNRGRHEFATEDE